jgi:alcohol dehydrogenase class IV
MNRLSLPVDVYLYNKVEFCKEILGEIKGKNLLLFMTSSCVKRLSLESWINVLYSNTSITWINKIPSNPTYKDIFEALKISRNKSFNVVVAIGGGSTMDMAKSCVGLTYLLNDNEFSEKVVLDCIKTKEYLQNTSDIPIYAVPTTAGTGSEVTHWATVWDIEGGAKYSVDAQHLYPKKAYIIPEFTLSMPKRLTLSTGLDALCQAVEAYWAKATNPMVKELSKIAIRLIIKYLPKVLEDSTNLHYREKMALGSLFSGLAFSNTRTTACHSISYPLTMRFGIEHGLACIISLPKVMEINLSAIDEVENLFEVLRIESAEGLQKWLDIVSEGVVDLKLSSFGVKIQNIDELVNMSFTLGRMDNNPVDITRVDVKKILESIM